MKAEAEHTALRVVWCLGVYGSASTWLFNVIRQIHEVAEQQSPHSYFVSERLDFQNLNRPGVTHLVKSHEVTDQTVLTRLASLADFIFITLRDPRDAVTSLMLYHNCAFDRALNLVEEATRLCLEFAKDRRAKIYRYEERFFEDAASVHAIAEQLGHRLPRTITDGIFQGLSRPAVERYIAALPGKKDVLVDRQSGDLLDLNTQWHSHHAGRSGEIGRWQSMLSEMQVQEVQNRFRYVFR